MKKMHLKYPAFLRLCVAALFTTVAGSTIANASPNALFSKYSDRTDRLIVKYKDTEPALKKGRPAPAISKDRVTQIQRIGQQFGLSMAAMHTIGTGAHVVKLNKRLSVSEARTIARQIAQDPSVEYAEPDRMMHALFTPNDTRYAEQWSYYETTGGIRMPEAWDKSTGSGTVVSVIDTGYRPHADLAGQFLPGYDFIADTMVSNDGDGRDNDASDPGDAISAGECGGGYPDQDYSSSWHGTHVAGTIAAVTNNSTGVSGVAYNAKILPVRVLGKCGGYISDIADAIIWASGGTVASVPANPNKAHVINLSLGGSGACDTTFQNAINSARSRGTVVVVAAGNENQNASNSTPANCAGVIAVAATNRSGGRAWYSNYGAVVDIAAPGGDTGSSVGNGILSTLNAGTTSPGADNYAFYQGTSMAAPHVAGVAALMLAKNPSLMPDEVETRMKDSARAFPVSCSNCGKGIVNASAAVDAADGTTPPPPPPPPPPPEYVETEPNNSRANANSVSISGTVANGTMGSSSDNDYFEVQLPAGATLTATLNAALRTADYDLYVYNSSGFLIDASLNEAGLPDTVSASNTGSSTVARYVRVRYYSGGTGSTNGKYTLKLSW